MSFDLGTLVAKLKADTTQLDGSLRGMDGKMRSAGNRAGGAAMDGMQSGMSAKGAALASFAGNLAANIAMKLGGMAVQGVKSGIAIAAGMETAQIGFTTMLGSAQKADSFIRDLQSFAAKTPFDFPGLQKSASSLVSIGIQTDKIIPIMTTLGNVTSGMGTGAEGIQRATVALQQMNAAGKIQAEDLNQLRDAGIPVYDLLAASLGKTKSQVAEMAQKGKLGKDALDKMMSALETGKGLERFSGLMDKQSESLSGLWSTIQDTVGMGLAQVMTPLVPLIKDGLGAAIAFLGPASQQAAGGITWLMGAGKALYDLIVGGDFTGEFAKIFHVEEDSTAVDILFRIRDAALWLYDTAQLVGTYLGETFANALHLDEATPGIDLLWRVQQALGEVYNWLVNVAGYITSSFADALMLDEATPTIDILMRVQEALQGLGPMLDAVGTLWSTVWANIQSIMMAVLPIIIPLLATLWTVVIEQIIPAFLSFYTQVAGWLTQLVGVAGEFVTGVLTRIQPMVPTIQAIFQTIGVIISTAMALIVAIIGPVVGWIVATWKAHGDQIMNVVGTAFGAVLSLIKGVLGFIQGVLKAALAIMHGDWQGAWNGIKSATVSLFTGLYGFFRGAMALIGQIISLALSTMVGFFRSFPGKVFRVLDSLGGFLRTAMLNGLGKMGDAVSGGIEKVLGWFGSLPGKIAGKLANLGSLLWSAGSSIIGGLLDGLKAKWNDVTGFVSGIAGWIADHKGPLSYDAKLLRPHGRAIIAGLGDAMVGEIPHLQGKLDQVTDTIRNTDSSMQGRIGSAGGYQAVGKGIPETITLVDSDGTFIARMKTEARSAVESDWDKGNTYARMEGASL